MPNESYDLQGTRVYACSPEGAVFRTGRDATDLISAAWNEKAQIVVIPAQRLGDNFFQLRTGVAGEIMQKFVNYNMRLAIVGDISRYVTESKPLRDLVYESNKGSQVWFFSSVEELAEKLASA